MDAPPIETITTQGELDRNCAAWREAGTLAFDTEFIRDDTFDAILCLVQVAASGKVTLIDPTTGIDIQPFWRLVADPQVLKIVHAGKEDFELCLTATGSVPRNIFDVQIAAGLVGLGYPLNLVRLVDRSLGRRIEKGETLTDWLRRPLTNDQLQYAIEDVAHLPEVHAALTQHLEKRGRTAWAREEFLRFEQAELYRPPPVSRCLKFKGARKLNGAGLATLERLIDWRDHWARRHNRPCRAMVRDDVLVEIARRRPRKIDDLLVMRGFHQARNPRIAEEVLRIVADARTIPPELWPRMPQEREQSPMMKATIDLLSAVLRAVCDESGVSHDLVGAGQRLRELVEYLQFGAEQMPALLSGWRAEFVGSMLVGFLEGKMQLRVAGWPREPYVDIVPHNDR